MSALCQTECTFGTRLIGVLLAQIYHRDGSLQKPMHHPFISGHRNIFLTRKNLLQALYGHKRASQEILVFYGAARWPTLYATHTPPLLAPALTSNFTLKNTFGWTPLWLDNSKSGSQ